MSLAREIRELGAKGSQGFLRRLFVENGVPGRDSTSRSASASPLDLGDIQGFILRGYRMPMVRHFLLTVGVPAEARMLFGGSLAAMSPARRRSPPPKTGTSGSSRGREITALMSRVASRTIASTSALPGPG